MCRAETSTETSTQTRWHSHCWGWAARDTANSPRQKVWPLGFQKVNRQEFCVSRNIIRATRAIGVATDFDPEQFTSGETVHLCAAREGHIAGDDHARGSGRTDAITFRGGETIGVDV